MEKYTILYCQSCGEVLSGVEEYDDRDLTTQYCHNVEIDSSDVIVNAKKE